MLKTTHFGLNKPEQHEYYNVDDFNANADIIDSQMWGLSGKRTSHFTVGTAQAGWSAADCDYLCDGSNDSAVLQAALDALPDSGGEIVLLDGTYSLTKDLDVRERNVARYISLRGNGAATVISGKKLYIHSSYSAGSELKTIHISVQNMAFLNSCISLKYVGCFISGCTLWDSRVSCQFSTENEVVEPEINISDNYFLITKSLGNGDCIEVRAVWSESCASAVVKGNTIVFECTDFYRNGIYAIGSVSVAGNTIRGSIQGYGIYLEKGPTCVGNILRKCSLNVSCCTATGNHIIDGSIAVDSAMLVNFPSDFAGAVISGNVVENGAILALGFCTVIGNSIYGVSGRACIQLLRSGSNDTTEISPIVNGNICNGGDYGIRLAKDPTNDPIEKSKALLIGNRLIGSSIAAIKIESNWSECVILDNFCDGAVVDEGSNNTIRYPTGSVSGGGTTAAGMTQEQADKRYVPLTGGTMTGPLTLNDAPTAELHAVTKKYIDEAVSAAVQGSWEASY